MDHQFSVIAHGTNATTNATKAGSSGVTIFLTSISGHVDTDTLVQVLDGTDIIWQTSIDIGVEGTSFEFLPKLHSSSGSSLTGRIVTSTTDCSVTICGYTIP